MKLGLFEIIWLLDILNIQGLEYLDTIGPNGLGWTLIFISIFVFSFIIGLFTKLKEKSCCGNCKEYDNSKVDKLERDVKYLEDRNEELHKNLIDTIIKRDEYKEKVKLYEGRHEYDMRKRKELEEELEKYKR